MLTLIRFLILDYITQQTQQELYCTYAGTIIILFSYCIYTLKK